MGIVNQAARNCCIADHPDVQAIARQIASLDSWPRNPTDYPLLRVVHGAGLTGHPRQLLPALLYLLHPCSRVLGGLKWTSCPFLPYWLLVFGAVLKVAHTGKSPGSDDRTICDYSLGLQRSISSCAGRVPYPGP